MPVILPQRHGNLIQLSGSLSLFLCVEFRLKGKKVDHKHIPSFSCSVRYQEVHYALSLLGIELSKTYHYPRMLHLAGVISSYMVLRSRSCALGAGGLETGNAHDCISLSHYSNLSTQSSTLESALSWSLA